VHIVGGGVGDTALRAAQALVERHRGLRLAGASVPPFGFEHDPEQLAAVVAEVVASDADLVLIGLGFPKQERLAELLATRLPAAWLLGCGGGVALAAGDSKRPPAWTQRLGVEWIVRLVQEPRRLARRYLIDDAPAALVLLAGSIQTRIKARLAR
jgi:N-acetylglucosaminyldiphosphoundecaprenol N-acetyl-beta-D-mannosaminyltransferase